eukprot:14786203-Alexandrium_andersonii.AAC.1
MANRPNCEFDPMQVSPPPEDDFFPIPRTRWGGGGGGWISLDKCRARVHARTHTDAHRPAQL